MWGLITLLQTLLHEGESIPPYAFLFLLAAAKRTPECLAQISTSLWEAWRLGQINPKGNQHQISDKQGQASRYTDLVLSLEQG